MHTVFYSARIEARRVRSEVLPAYAAIGAPTLVIRMARDAIRRAAAAIKDRSEAGAAAAAEELSRFQP